MCEFSGCDPSILSDIDRIAVMMVQAAKLAGATVMESAFHRFEPQGVSGTVILAESHLSVHTWPEKGYAAFDVFMCGDAEPRKAIDVFKRAFKPGRVVVGEHKRGVV